MRLSSFSVRNYRGVENAGASDLSNLSTVVLSGRNGTGKSLILEALLFGWFPQFNHADRVGPWDNTCSISLTVALTEAELQALQGWLRKAGQPEIPDLRPEDFAAELEFNRINMIRSVAGRVVGVLRQPAFVRDHPFAQFTFLPANRIVQLNRSANVELQMLSAERREQERSQSLHQYMSDRSPLHLGNVASYLVSVDYQDLLNEREGRGTTDNYAAIVDPLRRATGKEVRVPKSDAARGSIVEVATPTGHTHEIDMLSTGEQSLVSLLYYLHRLGQTGGVLCLDEPEQHLHPSLQASMLGEISNTTRQAQVLIVSHSAPLIASAPEESVFQVDAPQAGTNQIRPALGTDARRELLGMLGLRVSDVVQADFVLVVEGADDQKRMATIFPSELARARIVIAGGGDQVVQMARTLSRSGSVLGIPWIAVRDRDFLTDDEVTRLGVQHPELHVWPARELESLLLNPTLLATTLTKIGRPTSVDDARTLLSNAASDLWEEVLEKLVRSRLHERFRPPAIESGGNRWDQLAAEYHAYAQGAQDRAEHVETVRDELRLALDAEWPRSMLSLADPKVVLKRVHSHTRVFASDTALVDALIAHLRDVPGDRPEALQRFAERFLAQARRPGA